MGSFFSGLAYQWRGLKLSLKTPRLLFLGLARLVIVMALAVAASAVLLMYHTEMLNAVWARPESAWLTWVWVVLSWLMAVLLVGVASLVAYLLAQIAFAVFIMDMMSRITERIATGQVAAPTEVSIARQLGYLVGQEIPRSILPVLISLMVLMLGWFTPLGPVLAVVSAVTAAAFLAWDNTDLVPARQMIPFKARFGLFLRTLPFHIGFGLWFLVPLANIVFLSFAPVGATLYQVSRSEASTG